MATAPVLDFARLLNAIPGDAPAGVDLRADSSPVSPYYAIKGAHTAARNAERQLAAGTEANGEGGPDWEKVRQPAERALAEKTKDLEVTVYLIDALVRLKGFAGLRDGFRLARELVEKYWDGLYPRPDEEGVATRVAQLSSLASGDSLVVQMNRVPVTDSASHGRLSLANYREGKKAGTPETFDRAVAETPAAFFVGLTEDLAQCRAEYEKLGAALDQRCGADAPPTSNVKAALTACLDTINEVARDKLEEAKRAAEKPPAAPEAGPGDGKPRAKAPANRLQTREDAFRMLQEVVEFFRRTEPQNAIITSLELAVRYGKMNMADLLAEVITDEGPRKAVYRQLGIKPPEPAGKEKK
jgi:type VI secretion system protein ImpA